MRPFPRPDLTFRPPSGARLAATIGLIALVREEIRSRFERQIPGIPFGIVESPYRQLVRPLIRYLEDTAGRFLVVTR